MLQFEWILPQQRAKGMREQISEKKSNSKAKVKQIGVLTGFKLNILTMKPGYVHTGYAHKLIEFPIKC